jgi:predicted nucleic acid-binding protein
VILDTSVLYDSLIAGPRSNAARDLLSSIDVWSAPDLIQVEFASALTKAVRRGEIGADQARLNHEDAKELMPEILSSSPLIDRALELSLSLGHPAADCVFLALAELQNEPLATSDAKFARKLAGTPYARLIKLIEP